MERPMKYLIALTVAATALFTLLSPDPLSSRRLHDTYLGMLSETANAATGMRAHLRSNSVIIDNGGLGRLHELPFDEILVEAINTKTRLLQLTVYSDGLEIERLEIPFLEVVPNAVRNPGIVFYRTIFFANDVGTDPFFRRNMRVNIMVSRAGKDLSITYLHIHLRDELKNYSLVNRNSSVSGYFTPAIN